MSTPSPSRSLSPRLLFLLPEAVMLGVMSERRGRSARVGMAHRPKGTVALEAVLLRLTTLENRALQNRSKVGLILLNICNIPELDKQC